MNLHKPSGMTKPLFFLAEFPYGLSYVASLFQAVNGCERNDARRKGTVSLTPAPLPPRTGMASRSNAIARIPTRALKWNLRGPKPASKARLWPRELVERGGSRCEC